ncbi:MAG TPA: hypothetical protein VGJ80_11390 [Gemmatimonadales bacterium]|jgi:hypothetical protein
MTAGPSIGLLVDQAMERRLRRALPRVPFTALKDWLDLAFFDLESPAVAFIVDPTLLPAEHRRETMRRLGERRHVPVILYAGMMRPDLALILLEMGKLGVRHVLLHPVEDDSEAIRSALTSAVLHQRHH